jgi:hypothetical protein
MKRLILMLALVPAAFLIASCSATYNETWRGPAGKATPAGTGYAVNGQEFIPVGYYTWRDLKGKEYREMVFVKRPVAGGGK